jgi:hypothetical protein
MELTALNAELSGNPPIGTVSTSSNADEWNVADHLNLCLELVRTYPEDISLHQYLADAYVQSRRFPEANFSAENTLDLDPKNAQATNLSEIIHGNLHCDICETILSGLRHKCIECWDYDLCDKCFNQEHKPHSEHDFLTIPRMEWIQKRFKGI